MSEQKMVSVPSERTLLLVNLLAAVASAAFRLMDNSEDSGEGGISVQRDDVNSLDSALDQCDELPELPGPYVRDGWLRAADELRAILAQPAAQSQGEPVAYEKPCDYWEGLTGHIDHKDPADLKKMVAHLEGLLDAIPDGPLYAHPDSGEFDVRKIMLDVVPGADGMGEEVYAKSVDDVVSTLSKQGDRIEDLESEVERLRAEVKRLDLMVSQADYNYDEDRAQFKRDLAEREALLLEVVGTGNLCAENEPTGQTVDLNDRIEALLAASAAPEVKS